MHVIKWRTSLIAWTNDAGVKVYDTASHQRITFIERSPRANLSRPTLVWQVIFQHVSLAVNKINLFSSMDCTNQAFADLIISTNLSYQFVLLFFLLQDDTVLLIGWADCIKIAVVRTRGWDGLAGTLGPGTKYVEIRTTLQTDYYVSGLAPFGDQLVVLAYLPDKEDNEAEPLSTAFPSQVLESQRFFRFSG